MNGRIELTCNCGSNFQVGNYTFKYSPKDKIWRCRLCNDKYRKSLIDALSEEEKIKHSKNKSEKSKSYWNNLSDEEKEADRQRKRDMWSNRSKEELKKITERTSIQFKRFWANIDKDEKQKIAEKVSIGNKTYWEQAPPEWKQLKQQQLAEGNGRWWSGLSEEDRMAHGQQISDYWKNISGEVIQEHANRMSKNITNYWSEMTEEEYNRKCSDMSKIRQNYFDNLSDEELKEISNSVVENRKRWLASLSEEELREVSEERSVLTKEQWENLLLDDFNKMMLKRNLKSLNKNPTNTLELQFMEDLKLRNISFNPSFTNLNIHKSFYELFSTNPITRSRLISAYHLWDFKINIGDRSILVDVDGSVHNLIEGIWVVNGIDIGLNTKFNDSQRLYQTDGLDAYIIECYNNKLKDDTSVLHLQSNTRMTYKEFIGYLKSIITLSLLDERDLNYIR